MMERPGKRVKNARISVSTRSVRSALALSSYVEQNGEAVGGGMMAQGAEVLHIQMQLCELTLRDYLREHPDEARAIMLARKPASKSVSQSDHFSFRPWQNALLASRMVSNTRSDAKS